MNTPEKITELQANEIVVVGTNTAGRHGGGIAREAALKWGLLDGYSEGLIGRCYGFPTLFGDYSKISMGMLEAQRDDFYECARANPGLVFLLTKVGCGIAGFSEDEIRPLFSDTPPNVIKPQGW